ncbi:MAG: hypothetical protein KDA87_25000 [Planctomycetales bacterium]|nr:hypothetical protein [Planctomycetales bacterium]
MAADIWNGSEWQEIRRLEGAKPAVDFWQTVDLPLPQDLLRADFRLRFRALVSAAREDANVDSIRITAIRLDER